MEARDKDAIDVLLKLARFCGISPPERPSRSATYYQIFTLLFTLILSVFSIYRNARDYYGSMDTMYVFIDLLTSVFITIQGTSTLITSLLFSDVWRRLLKGLREGLNPKTKKTVKPSVCLEILLLHVVFLVRVALNYSVWIKVVGWNLYRFYIFRQFHEYYAMVSIALMVHVNLVVKRRFRALNTSLSLVPKKFEPQLPMKQAEMTYRKLTELMEYFSSVFGYQILFAMANTIVVMLESLRNALRNHDFNVGNNVLIVGWSAASTALALVGLDALTLMILNKASGF